MIRLSMLFDYRSGFGKSGGWSESWYIPGILLGGDYTQKARHFAQSRAIILPDTITIGAIRVTEINSDGISSLKSLVLPVTVVGAGGRAQDVPQNALMCSVQGVGVDNVKAFDLRGNADDSFVRGDFTDGVGVSPNFRLMMRGFAAEGACFRAVDLSKPKAAILSIDATGTFVLQENLTFAENNYVTLFRVRDVTGKKVAGTFRIDTVTDARHGKLIGWKGATVGPSGKMRVRVFIFPPIKADSAKIKGVGTRKIGRPFNVYHGRAGSGR